MFYTVGDVATMANDTLGITNIDGRLPFITKYIKDVLPRLPYIIAFKQKTEKLVPSGDEDGSFLLPKDFYTHHDTGHGQIGYAEVAWENMGDNNTVKIDKMRKRVYVRGSKDPMISYWAYMMDEKGQLLVHEDASNTVVQYVIMMEAKRKSHGTEFRKYINISQIAKAEFDSALIIASGIARLSTNAQRREFRNQDNDILNRK